MKRDASPPQSVHFNFASIHHPPPKLRSANQSRPSASHPLRPAVVPISPIYPKSAPIRRGKAKPRPVAVSLAIDAQSRSLSSGQREKPTAVVSARGVGKRQNEPKSLLTDLSAASIRPLFPLRSVEFRRKSPLEAVNDACSLLIEGQNELKARLIQNEIVLQRLRNRENPSPVKDSKAVISEIRDQCRKSARKLWSRSETPNSRVQPLAYSQIPTPRNAGGASPWKWKKSDISVVSPLPEAPQIITDDASVTFNNGFVSGIQGIEKVTYMRHHRFPRDVFTRKRQTVCRERERQ